MIQGKFFNSFYLTGGLILICFLVCSCSQNDKPDLTNTIYKLGFQADTFSTGPLSNSGFILKLNETLPPIFVTAHHVVAGNGMDGKFLTWDEIKEKVKNTRIWSMHDSTVQIQLSDNIPIPNAETLKLDLAAYHLPSDEVPYLTPSPVDALPGDTIRLFSWIADNGKRTLENKGIVVYASDSIMVYELLYFNMARIMSGTSGSAVLDNNGKLVANSYAGFTIANEQVRSEVEGMFPVIKKVRTKIGKTYGAGVPVRLMQKNLLDAIQQSR